MMEPLLRGLWHPKSSRRVLWMLFWALLGLALGPVRARGSVALLLEMPYGELGTFNPTGHAALYFDHICAASPTSLRPCGPGELGVVISRYDGIGTYDWVAMPLVPYLFSVESAAEVPATMDRLTALRLRDLYRRAHLEQVAPDTAEGGMPQGNWYELVGSAFDRTLYGFQLKTTADQDAAMIALFNDRPNVTRYEGAFRNCADFARVALDRLFPGAVRRNYVADFGLTTPKSVARGVVRYGRKHPELGLTTFRVPQLEGSLPRSMGIQGVTGSLVTRYALPMAVLAPHLTAAIVVAYVGKGRFALPKDAPVLDVANLQGVPTPGRQDLRGLSPTAREGSSLPPASTGLLTGSGGSIGWADSLDAPACQFCDAVPFLP